MCICSARGTSKKSIRGGLVDGPGGASIFGSLKGVTIREPDPLAEFQDERAVYHDDIHDYSTNEPTMDGTASAILNVGVDEEQLFDGIASAALFECRFNFRA